MKLPFRPSGGIVATSGDESNVSKTQLAAQVFANLSARHSSTVVADALAYARKLRQYLGPDILDSGGIQRVCNCLQLLYDEFGQANVTEVFAFHNDLQTGSESVVGLRGGIATVDAPIQYDYEGLNFDGVSTKVKFTLGSSITNGTVAVHYVNVPSAQNNGATLWSFTPAAGSGSSQMGLEVNGVSYSPLTGQGGTNKFGESFTDWFFAGFNGNTGVKSPPAWYSYMQRSVVTTSYDNATTGGRMANAVDGLWNSELTVVKAASTANVTVSSAPATLDGVTLSVNDLVLLKNQTVASENGLYTFNGAAVALTRATTHNTPDTLPLGLRVVPSAGTQTASSFVLATAPPIVVGTTSLTFSSGSAFGWGFANITTAMNQLTIGAKQTSAGVYGNYFVGKVTSWVLLNKTYLSQRQQAVLAQAVRLLEPPRSNFVVMSDSRCWMDYYQPVLSWGYKLASRLERDYSKSVEWINLSPGNRQASQIATDLPFTVPAFRGGLPGQYSQVAFVHVGVNDIYYGATAAATWASLQAIWQRLRANGVKVVAFVEGGWGLPAYAVKAASTANITISAPPSTLDSQALTFGDIVLLKNQTVASENGDYTYNGAAVPLTRAQFTLDGGAKVYGLEQGRAYKVTGGAQAGSYFKLTHSARPPAVVGTTPFTAAGFTPSWSAPLGAILDSLNTLIEGSGGLYDWLVPTNRIIDMTDPRYNLDGIHWTDAASTKMADYLYATIGPSIVI